MKNIKYIISFILNLLWSIFKTVVKFGSKCVRFIHRKKRYSLPFYGLLSFLFLVILLVLTSGDKNFKKVLTNNYINDITQINPIQVNQIIKPHKIEDIVTAIKETTGPISIGGGKFSMGGQTGFENSLHLDMREFNNIISLNKELKQVTVQAGINWRDLQTRIDKENLSVKIMQTYANFTVGGSISVNCHGRYIGHGPIISSVLELKIISSSGEIIIANRNENQDIFNAAIGGYGGIGVIAEATLQLVDNVKVRRHIAQVEASKYNDFFQNTIKNDSNVIFQNGDLYPPNYDQVNNVSWKVSDKELTDTTRIRPKDENYFLASTLIEFVSWGDFGKWLRSDILDPLYLGSEKVVWRNNEASYDVAELEPISNGEQTYVLQEYFIPVNNIQSFIPKMKAIYDKFDVNVINVSIRHAHPDKESFLSWAPEEVFAFVIYYKQNTDITSKEIVKQWTIEMTDAIISENGKWYLPYQPHATIEQFNQAYPNAKKYFQIKKQVDSLQRFNNELLDKYNPYLTATINKERNHIKGYFRKEEQTILTVPEWYLVFNPKEYADYLEDGNNPSNFPFCASIDEYWKLYDRSSTLTSIAYQKNDEYYTMLKVIGVSITMEYAVKMVYENTIGEIFSWFANDSVSKNEQNIIMAQRAYSDFIYHTAWYEFEFMPWIQKTWKTTDNTDASWLRKWERIIFFTVEFSFKAAYAQLIDWAASASYEEPVTEIYAMVSSQNPIQPNPDLRIIKEQGNKKIIGITRWGAFTKSIIELSNSELEILEISGNDQIVVSLILKQKQSLTFKSLDQLYNSSIVTRPDMTRLVCILSVKELLPLIRYAKNNEIEVEHIFDY
mgnify:CR=1 FL=1